MVGSREIFIGVGIALLLLSLAALVIERRHLKSIQSAVVTIAVVVLGAAMLPVVIAADHTVTNDNDLQTRFEQESLYG